MTDQQRWTLRDFLDRQTGKCRLKLIDNGRGCSLDDRQAVFDLPASTNGLNNNWHASHRRQ